MLWCPSCHYTGREHRFWRGSPVLAISSERCTDGEAMYERSNGQIDGERMFEWNSHIQGHWCHHLHCIMGHPDMYVPGFPVYLFMF